MLNELLNAMMLAELLFDKTAASPGTRSVALRREYPFLAASVRILHVDDEPDIREVVELSLGEEPDFLTRSCGSGREALAVAADWKPDLLLLDLMMPQMDGAATLARLRADVRSSIPVVFMTAFCKLRQPDYFRSLGAAGVIYKPFEPTSLAAAVRFYL